MSSKKRRNKKNNRSKGNNSRNSNKTNSRKALDKASKAANRHHDDVVLTEVTEDSAAIEASADVNSSEETHLKNRNSAEPDFHEQISDASSDGCKGQEAESVAEKYSFDKHVIIKAGFILALIIFLLAVYSSGSSKDIDLSAVEEKCVNEFGLAKEMKKATDRDLMQFIGLDADNYEQVIYYRNTEELAVEELLIVKASSKDALAGVAEACDRRTENQIEVYSSYGPAQVKQLENSIKLEKGRYYFYCTSDSAAEYEEVLRDAI